MQYHRGMLIETASTPFLRMFSTLGTISVRVPWEAWDLLGRSQSQRYHSRRRRNERSLQSGGRTSWGNRVSMSSVDSSKPYKALHNSVACALSLEERRNASRKGCEVLRRGLSRTCRQSIFVH
jgi:hypothetical protein